MKNRSIVMKNKHPFTKMIAILVVIILICIGIILWKEITQDTVVFHEQIPIAQQEVLDNEEETNYVIQNKQSNHVQNTTQTELVAPILGTLESPNIQENGNEKVQIGYFYTQLDGNAKKIYEAVMQHKEDMKTGNYKITLGDTFQAVLKTDGGEQILQQAYQDAWDAIMTDFVDLFYLDTSKIYLFINSTKLWNIVNYEVSIGPEEGKYYYAVGYNNKQEVENAIYQLETIKAGCISKAT